MNVLNFKGGPATKVFTLAGYNWTRLGIIERNQSKMLERRLRRIVSKNIRNLLFTIGKAKVGRFNLGTIYE